MKLNCVCGRQATTIKTGFPWCSRCWAALNKTVEEIGQMLNLRRRKE